MKGSGESQPRVALFSTHFLQYSQTFVFDEVRAHRRYAVEVFAQRRRNQARFPFEPVHALEGDAVAPGVLGRGQQLLREAEANLYRLTCVSPRFDRVLRAKTFSLIHAHFGLGAVYALPFALRHALPLVVTFHGYDVPALRFPSLKPDMLRYKAVAPHLVKHLTLGLCASNELRELLIDMGVPAERLRVWRLGIDLSHFQPVVRSRAQTEVIMVGRFVQKKGFEIGIRAFADQIQRGAKGRLTLVGDGPRAEQVHALVGSLGIGEHVRFAGVVDRERLVGMVQQSDVLLAPSIVGFDGDRESGLLVVKEAGACGVPSIGTYHGGIHEIIEDGVTGFLVPERNVEALSERLGRFIADPTLSQRLGAAARAKMERDYDLFKRVEVLETLYDEACARHAVTQVEG